MFLRLIEELLCVGWLGGLRRGEFYFIGGGGAGLVI